MSDPSQHTAELKRPELVYFPLGNNVTAFSTTRHGGVSKGTYAEFNINAFCGDSPADIVSNRDLLCHELSIKASQLLIPHQVHSTECRRIEAGFFNRPEDERTALLEGVDALITDYRGICIGVSTADCIPILLYDPSHHAAAAIHAGWRGTLQRIAGLTVKAMELQFDTNPQTLKAVIGPGISMEAFEVGDEVYQLFSKHHFDMPSISRRYPILHPRDDEQQQKWHIDLKGCNRLQLLEAGMASQNILDAQICTYSHPADFFSARRLGISSGRIYTGIICR